MEQFYSPRRIIIEVMVIGLLALSVEIQAQEASSLRVEFATISKGVVSHEAIGAGTSFPASVGKLYCLTKMVNVKGPGKITHIWYHGSTERARITLAVDSPSWRTYSSKIIRPQEMGEWHVDVLNPEGEKLLSIPFEIRQ